MRSGRNAKRTVSITQWCVKYVKIDELSAQSFVCRRSSIPEVVTVRDEREYRIIYASDSGCDNWGFDIELQWIKHISLSPWLPEVLEESLVKD